MRPELPSGTVTFLFTDVEGSTKLLHELGAEGYARELAAHRLVVREAVAAHGGVEVDTQGDAFFVAFPTAPGAAAAAARIRRDLETGRIRVRMGLHSGAPHVTDEGYVGIDVHRAARIAACGHGGQILVSSSTAGLIDPAGLVDLGEHRLKDLSAPERIHQLGTGDHLPLRTLYRTNLPVPATPFFGREAELAELAHLLAAGEPRLVTLTGPGGTGKTRLALQAAAAAADHFPDGVYWVPLASLTDPGLVLATAAQALSARGELADHIGARTLLLLLDNFEHVADAATDVQQLLGACPNLHVVVTSRELLRTSGEQVYHVGPLGDDDGIALFRARAAAGGSPVERSAEVVELCARLEQLPLALELAAARARALPTARLLERLGGRLDLLKAGRGVDPRQQTLRATIEWSHDLLDPAEQELFARLGVFSGGWTLEAAEDVAGADIDVLQSLLDKSLVRTRGNGERFWMLETIREYAVERLASVTDADELRARHANHYYALAEEGEHELVGPDAQAWIQRLESDRDNLRAALEHYATADPRRLQRMTAMLVDLWTLAGPAAEGHRWFERALAADAAPTLERAHALHGAARLTVLRSDVEAVLSLARDALEQFGRYDHELGVARSKQLIAYALCELGRADEAERLAREAVETLENLGEAHLALWARRVCAFAAISQGKRQEGRAIHEENLARARALGNRRVAATVMGALAMLICDSGEPGDVERAAELLLENMPIFVSFTDVPISVEMNLTRAAWIVELAGDHACAATLLAHAVTAHEELGVDQVWITRNNDELLERLRESLDPEALTVAWDAGAGLGRDDAVALAMQALLRAARPDDAPPPASADPS